MQICICREMRYKFSDLYYDDTKNAKKLKSSEYKNIGKYIIVDQGKSLIAGYTDNEDGLYTDVPVIIFGDHTRNIKYINSPFFLGADGTKVLKSSLKNANYKYLYYLLKNASIPDTGYNRHYKWLKELMFEYHSQEQQNQIVTILDKLDLTISKYREELLLLDELVKARFVEMFGDPVTNDMLWNTDVLKDICTKIGSGSTPRGGKESYIDEGISLIRSMNVHNANFEYKDLAHITLDQAEKLNNVVVEHDDLLFNITGASVARCCVVPSDVLPARVNQHVCILRCIEKINPIFLQELLVNENYQDKLLQIAKSGATREAINKQQLESLEIILPPLELQNQFASFVQEIDKSRSRIQKSLEASQELFDSLMQEYFG